jgi:hypothetical protein
MTAPLTPPDCDLQDFPFMPLHVARLRDSDLAAEEHPEACWYAVMLWSAAWHQIPAGSLPDNETVLARLCGLGRDLKTFRKHRDGAMRGFILCDDGRLYHPTVAEQALAAWESKKQQRWRSECARIKKANQRNGTNLPTPTYEEFLAGVSPAHVAPGPEVVPGDTAECPPGQALQETGTGTGISKKEAIASSVRPEPDDSFAMAWKTYPVEGRKRSKSQAKTKPFWSAAAKAAGGAERLLAAVRRYVAEDQTHKGECGPPAFDRWLRDGRWEHWLPGGSGLGSADAPSPASTFDGPAEIRAWVAERHSEPYARSYLDPCSWSAADRTLIAANPFAENKLRHDLADICQRWKFSVRHAAGNDDTPKPDLFDRGAAAA